MYQLVLPSTDPVPSSTNDYHCHGRTSTNDKQRQTTIKDKPQTKTNDKQQLMTNKNKRQTIRNNKQQTAYYDKQHTKTNNKP